MIMCVHKLMNYSITFSELPNNITNVSFEATERIPADWDFTADENINGQIDVIDPSPTLIILIKKILQYKYKNNYNEINIIYIKHY